MDDKKIKIKTPQLALIPKKMRMTPVVKLHDNAAKDGLRERLRRFP